MAGDKSVNWKRTAQILTTATKDTLPNILCMLPGVGPMVGGATKVVLTAVDELLKENVKEEELGNELVKRKIVDEEKLEEARKELLTYVENKMKSEAGGKKPYYTTSVGFYTGGNGPLYVGDQRVIKELMDHEIDESTLDEDQAKWYGEAEAFLYDYEVEEWRCGYHWLEMDFFSDETAHEYDERAVLHMMRALNHMLGENKFLRYEIAGVDEDNELN